MRDWFLFSGKADQSEPLVILEVRLCPAADKSCYSKVVLYCFLEAVVRVLY